MSNSNRKKSQRTKRENKQQNIVPYVWIKPGDSEWGKPPIKVKVISKYRPSKLVSNPWVNRGVINLDGWSKIENSNGPKVSLSPLQIRTDLLSKSFEINTSNVKIIEKKLGYKLVKCQLPVSPNPKRPKPKKP